MLFVIGEKKLDIRSEDLQAFVLKDQEIETVQTEKFYRELLGNNDDPILILKKDAMIHFASDNFKHNLKYTGENLTNINFYNLIHPKDLPFVVEMMIDLLKNGKEMESMGPFRLKDTSGEYRMYISHTIPILNEDEEIVEIGNILKDVTDLSQIENEDYKKRLEEFAESIGENDEGGGAKYFYYYDDGDTYHYYTDPNNTTSTNTNYVDNNEEPTTTGTEKNPKDTKVQNDPGGTTNPPPNENKPVKEPKPISNKSN